MRHSDLALVLIRLKVKSDACMVLTRHPKWNDWTLVGGHVESDEKNDWARAAVREANEELAPLRFGTDFILLPLLDQPIQWGPRPSKSAGNEPTIYTAQLFALRFLKEPKECLARLPQKDFRIVREADVSSGAIEGEDVLTVASRALGSFQRAALAWDAPLSSPLLKGEDLHV